MSQRPRKGARKREAAVRATLSNYLDAVVSKRGVLLIRDRRTVWLDDDEMNRLTVEWLRTSDPALAASDDAGPT